jgi:hypothetical protein
MKTTAVQSSKSGGDARSGEVRVSNCATEKASSPGRSCRRVRRLIVGCTALCATLVATHALAYRTLNDRADSKDLPPIRWQSSTLEFSVSSRAPTLSVSDMQAALAEVSQKWSPACSTLMVQPATALSRAAVAGDGINTISWIDKGWVELGQDANAPAFTDVQIVKMEDGSEQVVEADIYLNADTIHWSVLPGPGVVTLEPVLLHEMGHALGLMHPCEQVFDGTVPECGSQFDTIVMNPGYSAARNELSDDDVRGVCNLYSAMSAAECTVDADCGPLRSCKKSACVEGSLPWGQPCTSHRDCFSGACSGTCSIACRTSADCVDSTQACTLDADGNGACTIDRTGFGSACTKEADCASERCLLKAPAASGVCTVACDRNHACPATWECAVVDDDTVCTPSATVDANGGCNIGFRGASPGSWSVLFILFLGRFSRLLHKKRGGL